MFTPGLQPSMHTIPPPNYCPSLGYNNIPFPQPFAPYYPPACNYYNNHVAGPFNSPNLNGNGSQLPGFNPSPQMPLFSQPPPGYGVNGVQMSQNPCTSNAVPSYQPVHMANVCSPSFNGFSAPNTLPLNNSFNRPPTTPQVNGKPMKDTNCFSRNENNRRNHEARDSPYYCDSCDRGFLSLYKFTQHKSEHITCKVDGCTFTAHSKIVEKHLMMQHRPDIIKRLVKGNSPEDIEKWIAERKKHFPTKEKIEVKQAQREEMQKRGERYAEQKRQFNERNNNFKAGSNNRFNRSTSNKNSRFASKTFAQRRNLTRVNTRKEPVTLGDEDCVLRNLLPFQGTAFYLNIETDAQKEECTISDDDYDVLSYDDNVAVISNNCTSKENMISEPEKSSETQDCLNKYFKNCDTVDECDVTDKNTNITKSTIDNIKLPNDPPVNHSVIPDPSVSNESKPKGVGSLALIQCYDSDSNDADDGDTDEPEDSKIAAPTLIEMESKKHDSIDRCKSGQDSSKIVRTEKINNESYLSPVDKTQPEKDDDSSDDSGPEEYSSKCVPIETDISESDPSSLREIEPEKKEIEPVSCSSKFVGEKIDEDCESKKRKRKRRRESKDETEGNEGTEKKVEVKLSSAFRTRKRYKPPTLLEKLLGTEIKHERNVILQCVRYVVQKDYFQIGKSDSS